MKVEEAKTHPELRKEILHRMPCQCMAERLIVRKVELRRWLPQD
jgi:hypothetical protein